MKILIAEDSDISRRILKSALVKWGYEVLSVTNGIEALAILQSDDAPSLAILDVNMPGIDGTDVCRQLRHAAKAKHTYILLLTANADKVDAVAGLEAGADDYLTKPFHPGELRARLQVGIRMFELQSDLAEHISVLQQTFGQLEQNAAALTLLNERMLMEISDRTRTEEDLRLQKILLESQSEASLDGILVISVEGKIISLNQRFIEIWGIADEVIALRSGAAALTALADKLVHPAEFLGLIDRPRDHVYEKVDKEILLTDGRVFHYYSTPVKSCDGVHYGQAFYFRDITEDKHLEIQLHQAQKLESVGQLAAGIAHEINTPTQYVSDNTRFLQDAFRDLFKVHRKYQEFFAAVRTGAGTSTLAAEVEGLLKEADVEYLIAEIPKAIQQSLVGSERISKIVRSMKEFAHPGTTEKQAADLNKAIESTITVASNEWKYVAEMVTDFDTSLPLIPCLLGAFNQVVLNLIINASHAIGDFLGADSVSKGTITISTRCAGQWAEVRVTDTGSGIPAAIRSRIFDPFFTTKVVGRGTGQGLAISHTVVVEKHGGELTFETEEGRGTTFIVRLPLEEWMVVSEQSAEVSGAR